LTPYRQSKLQSGADLDAAKVRELQNQEAMMQQFGFIPGAGAAPAAGAPSAVPGQASPLGATAGGAPTPAMPGGTPYTPAQPQVQTPQAPATDPFTAFAQRVSGLDDLQPMELQQIKNAAFAAAMDNEKDMTKVNTAVKNIIEARRAKVIRGREDEDYATKLAARDAQMEYLRERLPPDQLEAIKTPEQLQKAYENQTSIENDPKRKAAMQIAEMVSPGNESIKTLLANDPELSKDFYERYQANNTGSEADLKARMFAPSIKMQEGADGIMKPTIVDWKPTPSNLRRLEEETGLTGLTKSQAMRIRNSDKPTDTVEKIFAEQTASDIKVKDMGLHLRDRYVKDVEGTKKAMQAANRTKVLIENGEVENNPAAALVVLYDMIKVLDADSAVREGEVTLAQKTESTLDTIQTYMNRIQEGEVINPNTVKNLAGMVLRLGDQAEKSALKIQKDYTADARNYGVPVDMVIGNRDYTENEGQFNPENLTPQGESWNKEKIEKSLRENGPQSGTVYD